MTHRSAPGPTRTAVLALVPAADPVVEEHRRHLDPAAAWGVPAHVTVIYPFVAPEEVDAELVTLLGDAGRGLPTADDVELLARLADAYDDGARTPLSTQERAVLPLAVARQPAWSAHHWAADPRPGVALELARKAVVELPVARAVLHQLPVCRQALTRSSP